MRLSKIKLAGFKSFVDPTQVTLPSNLTGVVGPNGCGKSNIIDAVRWVLGESSAKHLRGGAMADVVFNGSNTRKPVGQASVELTFDNSDATITGEFARFSEIALRREVNRDGQSSYYLNGTRCRRRDITDLFLGTGLGPRSYAIIEQGMISRIIDAKPEELRNYMEEAAGISKYKERRRETENRIRHSRDNLERLNDLIEEVDKQLSKLDRQAKVAERYKVLKQQERMLDGQLLLLRLQALAEDHNQAKTHAAGCETAAEAALAKQRSIEREIETARGQHAELSEQLNETQGRYYAVGAEIARLEQAIAHARELANRQRQELEQARGALSDLDEHLALDGAELEALRLFLEENEPKLADMELEEKARSQALQQADQALRDWQQAWEKAQQAIAGPTQQAEVQRSKAEQLERQVRQHQDRLKRLEDEKQRLDTRALEAEVAALDGEEKQLAGQEQGLSGQLDAARAATAEKREESHQLAKQIDEQRRAAQSCEGRLASLKALQQAALAQDDKKARQWVADLGLAKSRRLAEILQVEAGWEQAVEVVLGDDLQAIEIDDISAWLGRFDGKRKASLGLFDAASVKPDGDAAHASGLPRLAAKLGTAGVTGGVTGGAMSGAMSGALGHVLIAEDWQSASAARGELAAHESIITRDGIWLGPNWLRLKAESDPRAGVLLREQQIRELEEEKLSIAAALADMNASLQAARQRLAESEQAEQDIQQQQRELHRRHSDARAKLAARQSRLEQLQARSQRIDEEHAEVAGQIERDRQAAQSALSARNTALEELEGLVGERDRLAGQREPLQQEVAGHRQALRSLREQRQQLAMQIQAKRTARDALNQSLSRMRKQHQSQLDRIDSLQENLDLATEPMAEQRSLLDDQLGKRAAVDEQLNSERARLGDVDARIREFDQSRFEAEEAVGKARENLEQARLRLQEISVRTSTVEEQLDEADVERAELESSLPVDASISAWEQELAAVGQKISRLGNINLAAIDEFKEQSERKTYLDAQHADLTEALETLETAIRKIDKQTRSLFADTFDRVNSKLQELFPKLFGGGHAYLELTEDDLLNTGITIMARPPGKKNASIQLLSGGEKALTAVALVFAFFELNPAPFCMLDEVDAPLDDANVGRFSAMVKAMSERVQFVFISHNKGTMEIANELLGVTMHELGVSRLVAVDVEEAIRLAEA